VSRRLRMTQPIIRSYPPRIMTVKFRPRKGCKTYTHDLTCVVFPTIHQSFHCSDESWLIFHFSFLPFHLSPLALPLDPTARELADFPAKARLARKLSGRSTPHAGLAIEYHLVVGSGFLPSEPFLKLFGAQEKRVRRRFDRQVLTARDFACGL